MWPRFVPAWKHRQLQVMSHGDDVYDMFEAAHKQINTRLKGRPVTEKNLAEVIKKLKKEKRSGVVMNLALLLAQSPRASVAQQEMDIRHGGYKNRTARLYELIDFNDSFVDTVLGLPKPELMEFPDVLKRHMQRLCDTVGVLMMSDDQYYAIVHGLSREVAVYNAAKREGFLVHMTTRVEDAHGADMVVSDKDGREMNIDCKTRSSFHFRLLDRKRDHLMTEEERLEAENDGFAVLRTGKRADFVRTTLVRVATQDLGEIKAFSFVDTARIGNLLKRAMKAQ